jgi:hypothetical protein
MIWFKLIKIILTPEQNQLAIEGGLKRQQRAEKDGRKDTHGFKGNPLATHIHGVGCEIAGYTLFGLVWKDTPYEPGERDLPNGLEIRGRTKHRYELLVWSTDDKERGYIHVTKEDYDPEYHIHGLMLGADAMQRCYYKQVTERPPSYFVPAKDLIPIEDILREYGITPPVQIE